MDYLIVIEKAPHNYAAYCPDVPGCITTGPTIKKTEKRMREALAFHLEFMRERGEPLPQPTSVGATVRVGSR